VLGQLVALAVLAPIGVALLVVAIRRAYRRFIAAFDRALSISLHGK
jgi:hypothetical protein